MFDEKFLTALDGYIEQHTGLDHPATCALLRAAREGRPFDLPEAGSPEGSVVRAVLAQAMEAARASASALPPVSASATAPVSAPSPAPAATAPAMSDEERAVAIRAIAGPEVPAATVNALISSGSSVSEAAVIIASIKATTAAQAKPRTPTIEQRMSGLPEFGGDFLPRLSPTEQAKAGWGKAFEQAEAKRSGQIGG